MRVRYHQVPYHVTDRETAQDGRTARRKGGLPQLADDKDQHDQQQGAEKHLHHVCQVILSTAVYFRHARLSLWRSPSRVPPRSIVVSLSSPSFALRLHPSFACPPLRHCVFC